MGNSATPLPNGVGGHRTRLEDRIVGTGVRKRTPAKARPLDVLRRADFGVSTDDFTGFQTGLPMVAVVGGVYGDDGCP